LNLDLTGKPPGKYEIVVEVEDLNAGNTAKQTVSVGVKG
jgi:hypothetical protein